ncbi:hypothetical protein GT354_27560 [Streptomyces sp. SID3343]|nr:hypothetical protein [Streptomyces sp. SID3343]MYW01967.1 hypothetical protein [Streptomyces sp. SID3343]
MLIAVAGRDRHAMAHHRKILKSGGHRPIITGAVLAHVWRTDPKTVWTLSELLKDCTVFRAADSQPAAPEAVGLCLPCNAGFTMADFRKAGDMCGTAILPPKKRPDVVDALVVMTALKHGYAIILTSDPQDIAAYRDTLHAEERRRVAILPVASLA